MPCLRAERLLHEAPKLGGAFRRIDLADQTAAADVDAAEDRALPARVPGVAGLAPDDRHALDRAVRVEVRRGQQLLLRLRQRQMLERVERRVRRVDVEHEAVRDDELAVGVVHLRRRRIENAARELEIDCADLVVELQQPFPRRRDVRLRSDQLAQLHDVDLVGGRQQHGRAGFHHGDAVDLDELGEQDVAPSHRLRRGALEHAPFLAGEHVAGAESPARLGVEDLVEAERRLETAAKIALQHGLEAPAAAAQELRRPALSQRLVLDLRVDVRLPYVEKPGHEDGDEG